MMRECYQNPKIISISSELLELSQLLSLILPSISYYPEQNDTFSSPLLVSRWFREKAFDLDPLPFVPFDQLYCLSKSYYDDDLFKVLEKETVMLNPFCIPIDYFNRSPYYGEFMPIYVGNQLEKLKLIYTEFRLSKNRTSFTPLIYGHEVIHSVLEQNKYSIGSYLNYEVLPMMFEKILANDFDQSGVLLNRIMLYRLQNLKEYITLLSDSSIDDFGKMKISTYLSSLLLSSDLFLKYLKAGIEGKCEMLEEFYHVIKDQSSIECLLDMFDISYQTSLEHTLQLMRKEETYVSI